MPLGSGEKELLFYSLNEAELRQWVEETHPARVNQRDWYKSTPLLVPVRDFKSLSLVVWLLDEKGANVNVADLWGGTPLHAAPSLEILNTLMDRGTYPTLSDDHDTVPLVHHASSGHVNRVARLLQDPRVLARINFKDKNGCTALRWAGGNDEEKTLSIFRLLLQAGSDPTVTDNAGDTPLDILRRQRTPNHAAIALLEHYPEAHKDAEKASLLVKARRLVVPATSNTVAPSCLQSRVSQGLLLPCVALVPLPKLMQTEREEEEDRKLRTALAFVCGLAEREGMPRDVFRGLFMDLLMPCWDPLRRYTIAGPLGRRREGKICG